MKDELLERLQSFEIDVAGAAYPFIARLARENGWDRDFATRVVAEYKRFVWLAMRAGHPVTPSQEVDEAWHLHLIYTRSYWDGMCRTVLGQRFHHGPTEGGQAEDAKFGDWYEKTLASYRHHFGQEPPADIWPPAALRFAKPATAPAMRDHWRIPKRWLKYLGLAAIIPALAGCTRLLGFMDGGSFVCFGVGIGVIGILIAIAKRGGGGGGGRGCRGGGIGACGSGFVHHDSSSSGDCDSGGSSGCGSSGGSSGCGGGGGGCGGGGCGGGGGS
ncbi:hypothetical protein [Luteolibacter sp. Populi]|uniref:glycine-rich domain-containing protein n=1 Tax=Luteolibacter sp. Populi TaxID=3230487 RepID=UPI003465CB06